MIFSENKKFIFIHIPKTGGTSVKTALKRVSLKENVVPLKYKTTSSQIRKHDVAIRVRDILNEKIWKSYYKFAFVRNPFDWVVSLYHYIKKDKKDPRYQIANKLNFKDFMRWFDKASSEKYPARLGQKSYITNKKGKIIVNFVGKLENFTEDFSKVCKSLNIKNTYLPRVNITNHKKYTKYYDSDTISLVGRIFKEDLRFLGYSF